MDPNTITYIPGSVEDAHGHLQAASAALAQCQSDLVNINSLLASVMSGQFHTAYQESMLQIERPLAHLAETVGIHGQVLSSITGDIMALDSSLAT
ncbi:hypothetical protein [Mycobacterium sp.]|jgi:uncharacterized protein YukE|uniref:hypothetical protein n=1 Tax=Mycobacterium sp. TaxID=1785 RepID=UPI003C77128E